ncbi:hypothetical protein Dda_6593 [Drechslerella dactyloides]|uniref:Rhodanese domain-containing protein n=1 Tax=Drechslerella dactyloides TaxID=74499 RepID=A0AAD6NHJ1_DREDA|nr:hypothetical protein Dda_6593 [Drechslerella dactyloides]
MEPLPDWIRNNPLGLPQGNQNANGGQQGQPQQGLQGQGLGLQAPVQQNAGVQGNVQQPNVYNYMPRLYPNFDAQNQPRNTYNDYLPNIGDYRYGPGTQPTVNQNPNVNTNVNANANANTNPRPFVFTRYGLENQDMMQIPTNMFQPQGTSNLQSTNPFEPARQTTADVNLDRFIINDDNTSTGPGRTDETRVGDITLGIARQPALQLLDSGIGSEIEWDFDTGDIEEIFAAGGRVPSGRGRSTVANSAMNSRGEVRTIAQFGASRDSLTEGFPPYYQERLSGRIRRLRQLDYDAEINKTLLNPLLAPAWRVIRIFAEEGVRIGRVTAAALYDYITRPGIRPRNYIIIDMRGDDPEIVRIDSALQQAQGRVRTIPFAADRSQLTDEQIRALGRGEPLSDDFCDREAARIFQEVANSDVEFVIVHCTYGAIRSPAAALALQMMVGPRKKVLLLEGGSQAFFKYAGDREAQIAYRAQRDQRDREREEAERVAREQAFELAQKRAEDDLITAGNNNYLEIPEILSPDLPRPRRIPSGLQNVSPQNRGLILGLAQQYSNIPLEEEDREETRQLDGELLLQQLASNPPTNTGCSRRAGGRPTGDDPFGDNAGGPGSPGAFGGGTGGLRKRDLGFMNGSRSRVLQGQTWGTFKPEKRGKGMRIVKRM